MPPTACRAKPSSATSKSLARPSSAFLQPTEATAGRIGHREQIIAFRNILIHGYDMLDHGLVLTTAENQVPKLLAEVEALLAERS